MKLIRKLVLSTLAVGALSATLAVTTYAWYHLNNAAFVEDFTFRASAGDGFLVSVDGVHYKHKLTSADIIGASLVNREPGTYSFNEDGKVKNQSGVLSELELERAYAEKIQMMPVTSFNGSNILNLASTEVKLNQGKYMQVDVYFKTLSSEAQDNQKYQIYVDGNDYHGDDGDVSKTRVWSDNYTTVNLQKDMMSYEFSDGQLTPKLYPQSTDEEPSTITVHTSNASRFSIEDLGYLEEAEVEIINVDDEGNEVIKTETVKRFSNEVLETPKTIIYELSENRYGDLDGNGKDLGSYATDYDGLDELGTLYNSTYNAMYTYYNNIRPNDTLEARLIAYDSKPVTVRNLNDGSNKPFIEIESGKIHKAILRFWIEGWDADCFDGLPGYLNDDGDEVEVNPINVCLLFNSIKSN